MSKPIDEKIVKMSVDNASFMSKVKETLAAMTQLGKGTDKVKGIDVSKAESSVKGLGKAVDGVKMDAISKGVEGIKSKFSAMSVVAITALQNITNKVVNAGTMMAKKFTVEPIMNGFSMYENKLKSIQTILANTQGKANLQDVTKSLGTLNDYANKTVYSFEDMTTNMGTFTAAGVDLKTSQVAIQGIGNLAASSGSSTQQAATAMYQLSQAIAAGKVGLQDWNSVVNAGMGGKKFQTALQNNAKAMGKNVDASKSFRDSLQDGWLTTDVLMKTLQQFANDKSMLKAATQSKTFSDAMDTIEDELKSGWANTWEAFLGGFNEAPKIWTAFANAIGDMVSKSATARTKLVKGFVDLGGRDTIIYTIQNAFNALKNTLKAVSDGFHDVFPAATAKSLMNIATQLNIFSAKMNLTDKQLKSVRQIASGVFSVFDLGIKVVKAIGGIFLALIPDSMGSGLLEVAGNIGKMITNFDKGIGPGTGFGKVLKGISKASNTLGKGFGAAMGGMDKFLKWVDKAGRAVGKYLSPAFADAGKGIGKFFDSLSFGDLLGGGAIAALAYGAKKLSTIGDSIKDFGDSIKDAFSVNKSDLNMLDELKDTLSAMTTGIKAASLLAIGLGVLAIAKALTMISKLKAQDIAKSLETMAVALYGMTKTLNALSKIKFSGGTTKAISTLIAVSLAIDMLAGAMTTISKIPSNKIAQGILGLATTMGILVAGIELLSLSGKKMKASSFQVVAIATAVIELSAALKILATIKASSLVNGLLAMGAAMAELAAFVLVVNKTRMSPTAAIGVMAVATSMILMSRALKVLATIKEDKLATGLEVIAALLTEIGVFGNLIKGLNLTAASVGIIAVAAAMNLMILPVEAFGGMSWTSIGKGLTTIAGALAAVVLAMKVAGGSIVGAVSIVAVATALNLLVVPITLLAHLSWSGLIKSMVGLAGVLGIVALAGVALTPGAIGLLAFSTAVGILGLGVMAIGAGLAAFATALHSLAKISTSSIASIAKNFNAFLRQMDQVVPNIVKIVVDAVVSIAAGIAKAAPSITNSGLKLISGLLKAIATNLPAVLGSGLKIVVELINGLAQGLPQLIAAGTNLVLSFINGLANSIRDNGPLIVQAVMNLMESIAEVIVTAFTTILDTLLGWIPGFSNIIGGLGSKATSALRATFKVGQVSKEQMNKYLMAIKGAIPGAQTAALKVVNGVIKGMSTGKQKAVAQALASGMSYKKALTSTTPGVAAAAKGLGQTAWNNAKKDLRGQGSNAGGTYKTGISSKKGSVSSAAKDLANAGKNGVKKTDWSQAGKHAGEGFGRGIKNATSAVVGFAQGLASSAVGALKKWLKIKSPSRVTMVVGDFFGQGFGKGIEKQGKNVINKATDMASAAVDAISSQAGAIQDAMNDNLSLQPVVTPVLDTSNLQGSADLSGTIAASASIRANGQPLVANQTYQFGDIKIDIQSPDAQTADMTMKTFKTMFKSALTDELREVKVTR